MITTGTNYLGDATVLVADATTLRNGVRKAIDMGYKKIIVEGDNTIVIQALR